MTWLLSRTDYRADGIFSELFEDDELLFVTCEHAYQQDDGTFAPKLPTGTYTCVRGMHKLQHYNKGMEFLTFEITGVPGHTGILFHPGNVNRDSDGCVLVGKKLITTAQVWLIQSSQDAFHLFLDRLEGVNEFDLTVE